MSERWPGGLISRSAPVVVGPTGGEGGSAPGIWTINQIAPYVKAGTWPLPVFPRYLYSFGRNTYGQLGNNTVVNKSSPIQVGSLSTWTDQICGGSYFSLAVKNDGTLWSWGRGVYGRLGLGNTTNYSSPVQVGALTNWSKVFAGTNTSFGVKTDGTLWAWGFNGSGQLGIGTTTNRSSPVQVGALTNWSNGSGGDAFTVALKTDGTLWSWGENQFGQLGQNISYGIQVNSPQQIGSETTWSAVSCGNQYAVALKTNGTMWSWGRNDYGQLGQNILSSIYRSSPVQVGGLSNWANISSATGGSFTVAVKTDGTLWSWGFNLYGQLGIGNTGYYSSPKQVGALTTWSKISAKDTTVVAIKTDGTLWSWGNGANGQLGLNNTTAYSSPKQIGSRTTWLSINGGTEYFFGIARENG